MAKRSEQVVLDRLTECMLCSASLGGLESDMAVMSKTKDGFL